MAAADFKFAVGRESVPGRFDSYAPPPFDIFLRGESRAKSLLYCREMLLIQTIRMTDAVSDSFAVTDKSGVSLESIILFPVHIRFNFSEKTDRNRILVKIFGNTRGTALIMIDRMARAFVIYASAKCQVCQLKSLLCADSAGGFPHSPVDKSLNAPIWIALPPFGREHG